MMNFETLSRSTIVFVVMVAMMLSVSPVAAQYASPAMSPAPMPTPAPSPFPTPTPTPAPVESFAALDPSVQAEWEAVEAAGFGPVYYATFVGDKGEKSVAFDPKLDLTDPKQKEIYDEYVKILETAINLVNLDEGLSKVYDKATVQFIVVPDIKAYLIANADKYKLTAEFVAMLKRKDFHLDSFMVVSKTADGKIVYRIVIDQEAFKKLSSLVIAINHELQHIAFFDGGKKFTTPTEEEIAAYEASIKSLEALLVQLEEKLGKDNKTVKDMKALIEAEKAKLESWKKMKAASPTPTPKP